VELRSDGRDVLTPIHGAAESPRCR
jgi:hypothetical protein